MVDLNKLLSKHPELKNYADFKTEGEEIIWKVKIDFKDFEISFDDYFFKKNHPEDEYADWIDKFYEDLYKIINSVCHENGYAIYDKSDCYKVEKIPEPTLEEKSAWKREERNYLLVTAVDPVVTNPLRWEELDEAQKSKYRAYRLYLLDIPQQEEFPDIEIKSFEEFLK